jgi:3-oxoacyl-(acyl-carrier-protein) synthase
MVTRTAADGDNNAPVMNAVSDQFNHEPERASRPFDRQRAAKNSFALGGTNCSLLARRWQ